MTSKRRKKHKPERIVVKLRDADAMLNAGKDLVALLQALEISEATLHRWRVQDGGMKSEEASTTTLADLVPDRFVLQTSRHEDTNPAKAEERSRGVRVRHRVGHRPQRAEGLVSDVPARASARR